MIRKDFRCLSGIISDPYFRLLVKTYSSFKTARLTSIAFPDADDPQTDLSLAIYPNFFILGKRSKNYPTGYFSIYRYDENKYKVNDGYLYRTDKNFVKLLTATLEFFYGQG